MTQYTPSSPAYGGANRAAGANQLGGAAAPSLARPSSANAAPGGHYGQGALSTIERVEKVIAQDTQILRSGNLDDLAKHSERKSHCLIELSRALRAIPADQADHAGLGARLKRLNGALHENAELLAARLLAIREVAELITQAIKDDRSDGTYGRPMNMART